MTPTETMRYNLRTVNDMRQLFLAPVLSASPDQLRMFAI